MEDEVWREIDGFPDYLVSSYGRVVHVDRPNVARKVGVNHRGFPCLVLFHKGHTGARYLRHVNKLVATAFLGPHPKGMDAVWHYDGDLLNCHVDNLKWDMRARVREWNDMHRNGEPKYKTPKIMDNRTGRIYNNAFECGLASGEIESAVLTHIEKYPAHLADRAKYRYVI